MQKKPFHSELFRKMIQADAENYWIKVYAETVYRIDDLESRKCTCFKCQQDLEKLRQFYDKISTDMHKKP